LPFLALTSPFLALTFRSDDVPARRLPLPSRCLGVPSRWLARGSGFRGVPTRWLAMTSRSESVTLPFLALTSRWRAMASRSQRVSRTLHALSSRLPREASALLAHPSDPLILRLGRRAVIHRLHREKSVRVALYVVSPRLVEGPQLAPLVEPARRTGCGVEVAGLPASPGAPLRFASCHGRNRFVMSCVPLMPHVFARQSRPQMFCRVASSE